MAEERTTSESMAALEAQEVLLPPGIGNLSLLRKVLAYHVVLASALIIAAVMFPGFVDHLPVGGVTDLASGGDSAFQDWVSEDAPVSDIEIVSSVIEATNSYDRLGYARQLMLVLAGVWLLVLPVSWVHKGIHKASAHDHSLDETTLILPGVVAAIVLIVQHSLALAFSLAGIVAGVHFRRALQDTFDALFILVAIGTGIAAGVAALEIAAVLTVFFCYSTLYVYFMGDGLESHHTARRKVLKEMRKNEAALKAEE